MSTNIAIGAVAMSTLQSAFYLLFYPDRREFHAGICSDGAALLAQIERAYLSLDLESSLVAPLSLQAAEELRTALHSQVAPAYSVSVSPVVDAFHDRDEREVRAVLRRQKIKTQRLSSVLQTQGEEGEEWRARIRYLRQVKLWQDHREEAEAQHRENERALKSVEEFISGLESHAEAIYVAQRIALPQEVELNQEMDGSQGSETHPGIKVDRASWIDLSKSRHDSLQIYAVASTAVGVARLSTYLKAQRDRSTRGGFQHPGGFFSFLADSTFSPAGPHRALYIQSVLTCSRWDTQFLGPHVAAGLKVIQSRLCAYPQASSELRKEAETLCKRFWDRITEGLSEP